MTPLEKQLLDSNFLRAAMNGHLQETKDYLARGASVNTTDRQGNNALIYAARHGWPQLTLFLIESGINKDHQNDDGRTALAEAVNLRNEMTALALLSQHVNPNLKDGDGLAPIHYVLIDAKTLGTDLPLLKGLLAASADINLQTGAGLSPLMMAVCNMKTEAFDILLKAGDADPDLKNLNGWTALTYAVSRVSWSEKTDYFMRTLVEAGADVSIKDDKGLTAIDHAANRGLNEAAIYLKREQTLNFRKGLTHPIKKPKTLRFKP
jgi:ankyrin repeat protein